MVRNIHIEPFAFSVHQNGSPYILNGWEKAEKKSLSKIKKDVSNPVYTRLICQVLQDAPEKKYGELLELIHDQCIANKLPLGENKIKELITYAQEKGIIKKSASGGYTNIKTNNYLNGLLV